MCVRPWARGCAGACARVRKRKSPKMPLYKGVYVIRQLKSRCGITVPHSLGSVARRSYHRIARTQRMGRTLPTLRYS